MSRVAGVNFNVSLPVVILREGKHFIAHSPVLDLSTSGKSFEEAKRRFSEVVEIFFEELIQMGTLDDVLGDLGWQKVRKKWQPPTLIAQEQENFRLKFVS